MTFSNVLLYLTLAWTATGVTLWITAEKYIDPRTPKLFIAKTVLLFVLISPWLFMKRYLRR